MVKVKSEIGLTLKLFRDSSFEFIRPSISLEIEVENEEDIESQLDLAEKAVRLSWDKATTLIDEMVIAEMPKVNEQMEIQVSQKLKNFEKQLDEFKKLLYKGGK